jgi:cell division protein FtsB
MKRGQSKHHPRQDDEFVDYDTSEHGIEFVLRDGKHYHTDHVVHHHVKKQKWVKPMLGVSAGLLIVGLAYFVMPPIIYSGEGINLAPLRAEVQKHSDALKHLAQRVEVFSKMAAERAGLVEATDSGNSIFVIGFGVLNAVLLLALFIAVLRMRAPTSITPKSIAADSVAVPATVATVPGLDKVTQMLERQMGALSKLSDQTTALTEELLKEKTELVAAQARAEAEMQSLADKLESSEMMRSMHRDEEQSLKKHVQNHWAELDAARGMAQNHASTLASLTSELALLRQEKEQLSKAKDQLAARVDSLSRENAELDVKLHSVSLERDRLAAQKTLKPAGAGAEGGDARAPGAKKGSLFSLADVHPPKNEFD